MEELIAGTKYMYECVWIEGLKKIVFKKWKVDQNILTFVRNPRAHSRIIKKNMQT